jgi:phosphate transport system substrate-binding protein
VQRIKGSIGYVEYAYAKKNKMNVGSVQNKDGAFVKPEDDTFQAAAAFADWKAPGMYQILTNQPGKNSWPITGASFILMHTKQDKPGQATQSLKFFDWAFKSGGPAADQLHYITLPKAVQDQVRTKWKAVSANGQPVWK